MTLTRQRRPEQSASYRKRFGFAVTGIVAHLIDDQGYIYCTAPVLYSRNTSEGYPICGMCRKRKQAGQGAIRL